MLYEKFYYNLVYFVNIFWGKKDVENWFLSFFLVREKVVLDEVCWMRFE